MDFGENFVNEDGIVFNPNQSDFASDSNNIIYDKNGDVESIYDPETGKTYRNKEVEETSEEKAKRIAGGGETEEEKIVREKLENETEKEKIAREKLENETEEDKKARIEKEEEEKAASKKKEYINSADYILKLSGYENEEIELESGVKKIADLTPEEQLGIIVQEYENIKTNQETVITEAKKTAEEEFFQNDGEKEIIEFLRDKGDIVDLAKYILDNSPSLVADMSDEDAIKKQLTDDYPEYTTEEIDEEIELLKTSGKLERKATLIKAKYKDKEIDISNLSKKLEIKNTETDTALQVEHQAKMDKFVTDIKTKKEIAGIPVNNEIRDYLLAGVVTEKFGDETDFIKSLKDPEKLMRLNFLDTYFETILESARKTSFKSGKKLGDNIIKKFSPSPILLSGAGKKPTKTKQPGSLDEVDVDEMVKVAEETF